MTLLTTPRLVLRDFRDGDADDLYAMDGDDRVMRYIGTGMPGRSYEQCAEAIPRIMTKAVEQPGYGLLHASLRDDGAFIGASGLFLLPETGEVEVAYRLPFVCWGRGYATEMARALLDHGFGALGLTRIIGLTFPENVPSQRVLEKIGMRSEGEGEYYGRTMRKYSATPEAR